MSNEDRLSAPKLEKDRAALLHEVFEYFHNRADYLPRISFEIDNQDKIEALDSLFQDATLDSTGDGQIHFSMKAYFVSNFWELDQRLIERVLPVLKEMYSTGPTINHSVESFFDHLRRRESIRVRSVDVQRLLRLLREFGVLGGFAEKDNADGRKVITNFQLSSLVLRASKIITDRVEAANKPAGSMASVLPNIREALTVQGKASMLSGVKRWDVIKHLGKGGQGDVSLVWDVAGLDQSIDAIGESVGELNSPAITGEAKFSAARRLLNTVVAVGGDRRLGALKKLYAKETEAYAKALKRMQFELLAMRDISHPHIVRLLDECLEDGWYVMEFFPGGTLSNVRERFKGDAQKSLAAFRDLVEALSLLHAKNVVHRDLKPENIYIRENGDLVVGDLGLAYFDEGPRITESYENVGSRDWMPGWAYGERQETVTKAFDVFALGKVLWAMISGKSKMRLWYFDRPEYDLTKLFPSQAEMIQVNQFLKKCVVEREADCILDAGKLLLEVDDLIGRLNYRFPHFDPKVGGKRACRACGEGNYYGVMKNTIAIALHPIGISDYRFQLCDRCGHLDVFYFADKNNPPVVWQ